MDLLKHIYASAYAASISIVITAVATLASEVSGGFKKFLANFTGHHWTTKSWLSILVFAIFYLIFKSFMRAPTPQQTGRSLMVLEIAFVLGFVALVGLFFYEFFE